ncbi:hypothetical protein [Streptomyces sp. NBC_00140]|uniref:hypothetical protein n=1 Tax=Streptomyces sp. NBC_00140 TaxID=2975664 RepID=UPI00225641B4|nr:hypothetical protein [Streptomyces sp. NBC_00140]MCX5338289.1 hypothetical protein [Streptomyces sp. NBC_00140]
MIWVRPLKNGRDALAGIAELANFAATEGADEVVLAWETHDIAGITAGINTHTARDTSSSVPHTGPLDPARLISDLRIQQCADPGQPQRRFGT